MNRIKHLFLLALCALVAAPSLQAQIDSYPWTEDFSEAGSFEEFTTIDANNDLQQWYYDDFAAAAFCSRDNNANDWLILPAFTFDEGASYSFSFSVAGYSDDVAETFEVRLGRTDQSTSGYTLLYAGSVSSSELQQQTCSFTISETGTYYLAIRYNTSGTAYAGSLTVDNLEVEEGVNPASPAAISDLTVRAGDKGALTASVSFSAPSTTVEGVSNLTLSRIDLFRNGELVKTFATPTVGGALSYEDTSLREGLYTYSAVAVNDYGTSEPAAASVFVGHDTPLPPSNIHVVYSDGKAHITWDAPTQGVNGGYVDTSALTYTIRNNKSSLVASDITALSAEDTPEVGSEQAVLFYYVTAKAGSKTSERGRSNMLALGEPTPLPYAESFPNGTRSTFWVTEYDKMARFWPLAAGNDAQDGDNGVLCFNAMQGDEWSRYFSGPISLKGAQNPVYTFHVFFVDPSDDPLNVEIAAAGGDLQTLMTVPLNDFEREGQWTKYTLSLKDYVDAEYIQIGFSAHLQSAISLIYIDNISIRDLHAHDLALQSLDVARDLKVGEQRAFTATVANLGTEDVSAGSYTVGFYADGRRLASANGRALAAEATRNYVFNVKADIDLPAEAEVYALIDYADDEYETNNRSEVYTLTVHPNYYPLPTALKAEGGEGNVVLTWNAPEAPRTEDGRVTEDFEKAPDFCITNFGDWTLYDGDGGYTYGITVGENDVEFPNNGAQMAYVVMNAKAVGLPASWYAHSGEKMLASMSTAHENDNWLISPQLSGAEQTVTFYAKSVSSEYPEVYQLLYSTLDVQPTSFRQIDKDVTLTNEWTLCEHDLPEGAKYFAIRSIRNNGFALFVDNVTFSPDSLAARDLMLTGYNVYRNGERLNASPLSQPTFTDTTAPANATYRVTAVYEEGESAYSAPAQIGTSGIEAVIPSTPATKAEAFDLLGRRVAQPQRGVYIHNGKKIVR